MVWGVRSETETPTHPRLIVLRWLRGLRGKAISLPCTLLLGQALATYPVTSVCTHLSSRSGHISWLHTNFLSTSEQQYWL